LGIKLLVPAIASILILGSIGIVQQSYGLTDQAPSYRGDDCAVTWDYTIPGSRTTPTLGAMFAGGTCAAGNPGTLNTAINKYFCEGPPVLAGEVEAQGAEGFTCHAEVPNFDDQFNTKLIRFQVWWEGPRAPLLNDPIKPSPSSAADCDMIERVVLQLQSPGHYYEDWICHPNPDNERLWFLVENSVITLLRVDSISFDRNAVGGDIIPLDTTMVLAAGAQYTAAWMIPVLVSAIGIGIVIARKF